MNMKPLIDGCPRDCCLAPLVVSAATVALVAEGSIVGTTESFSSPTLIGFDEALSLSRQSLTYLAPLQL